MKFDIGWLSGVSVFKFFEIFRYLDCYDAEDYIFYIRKDIEYDFNVLDEKLLMIKNIFEAYDNFFHHNIKFPEIEVKEKKDMPPSDPEGFKTEGFFESKKHFHDWKESCPLWAMFVHGDKDFCKIKSPNPDKKYVTISLINDERKNQKNYQYLTNEGRSIRLEYVDFLLDNLCRDDNVKNLGDSRGFKTSRELIEKIEFIRRSKFYIGSKCSWKDMARIFGIPILIIEMPPTLQKSERNLLLM